MIFVVGPAGGAGDAPTGAFPFAVTDGIPGAIFAAAPPPITPGIGPDALRDWNGETAEGGSDGCRTGVCGTGTGAVPSIPMPPRPPMFAPALTCVGDVIPMGPPPVTAPLGTEAMLIPGMPGTREAFILS